MRHCAGIRGDLDRLVGGAQQSLAGEASRRRNATGPRTCTDDTNRWGDAGTGTRKSGIVFPQLSREASRCGDVGIDRRSSRI